MFQPTKEQKQIIESQSDKILVSASAGTGKTTVMINRIVHLLEQGKTTPEELLVITFTTAAASEMKERLSTAVSALPSLHKLIPKLSSATIGTIHSFCASLVRQFFYIAGVDPDFSVMDEWKNSAMKKRVLNKVFKEYYAANDVVFLELIRITGKRNDDGLAEIITEMLAFRECIPDFDAYLKKSSDYIKLFDLCMELLKKQTQATINYYLKKASNHMHNAQAQAPKAYALLKEFCDGLTVSYDYDIFELKQYLESIKLPQARKSTKNTLADDHYTDIYKKLKNDFQKDLKKSLDVIDGQTKKGAFIRFVRSYPYCRKLTDIFLKFDEAYEKEKREQGLLDFSSLERYTMKLLGSPEALSSIKNRYKYVFVDEYQDVNDVQEFIISAICSDCNSFMVGDVKQCIYGFRMSEPDNFRKRRLSFLENGEVYELTENFRSDKNILDFVNRVFSQTMTADFGGCDYQQQALLKGRYTLPASDITGVHLLKYEKDNTQKPKPSEKIRMGEIYDIRSESKTSDREGELIAKRIIQTVGSEITVNDTPVKLTYSDITVLARKKSTLVDIYRTLLHFGIPARLTFNNEFLQDDEIKQLVSMLKIIANHTDDLNMFNALTGFFGCFTYQEVCDITASEGSGHLYDKVKVLSQSDEKCKRFTELLNRYKLMSLGYTADELLSNMVNLSGFRSYVLSLERGAERIAIVDSFLSAINEVFECRSLNGMLKFLDDCEMNGNMTSVNDIQAVKLMTVHSSKGLEFPIVFLAGIDGRFNLDNKTVSLDKLGGISMKCYDSEHRRIYESPVFSVNCSLKRHRDTEEELRLLYVAMTRAKYGLFIVCSVTDDIEKRPDTALNSSVWINNTVYNDTELQLSDSEKGYTIDYYPYIEENFRPLSPLQKYKELTDRLIIPINQDDRQEAEKLRQGFIFQPKYQLPKKVVSSKLKSEFEEAEEIEKHYMLSDDVPLVSADPFKDMTDEVERLKQNTLNTDLGTAYHKLLECVRLKKSNSEDIGFYADKLLDEGFIKKEIYDVLDLDIVVNATHDENLRKTIEGCELFFEQRFISRINVNELTDRLTINDNVILQGAIDLLGIDKANKKAVVIDYKYTNSLYKLQEKYSVQLNSYKTAIKKLLSDYDITAYIYALKQNKLIEIQNTIEEK